MHRLRLRLLPPISLLCPYPSRASDPLHKTGDVVLKDLKLKAEALNTLKLLVTVKVGFVGTTTLKVPWKSLGKEPVIVLIDRVFVLAYPASDSWTIKRRIGKNFSKPSSSRLSYV